jgi:polysaccharide deacetylase family protein (PEP-CTERM system associated)
LITFTIDLEDPTDEYAAYGRHVVMTWKILDLCGEKNTKATFFVIGKVAETAPDLIKAIAAQGHEVAYHSHAHVPLTEENPERFRRESREDKDKLEQLAGKPVIGFRAPRFSLTPKSAWALDILKELGFRYSSSIMPTNISMFGFPDAKPTPFKWPNGLIELPLPVANVGPWRVPYLGGIYLYALPFFLVKHWAKQDSTNVLWTYTHPYDFDREEKFKKMPDASLGVSAILWIARLVAERKIQKVLELGTAPPLAERYLTLPGIYS